MIRGEGTEVVHGVTPQEVWEFVMDPAQYTKADTKIVWVTKLADTDDGMIGLEEGKFFGMRGSVVTRYRWTPDHRRMSVTLVHGLLKSLNASFEIDDVEGGTRVHHVEEMEMAFGPFGRLLEAGARKWLADSVRQEVSEIKRLLEAGERGKWPS
ncbi:MAG: SRPBCC family protein [Actinomycetota bacterium]